MKRQSGSAHVIIIVILVLVILGLLGFVFWQNFLNKQQDKASQAETSKTVAKKKQGKELPRSANWLVYESQNKKYSIAIPDGWHLMASRDGDDLYAVSSKWVTFTSGVTAQVNLVEGGGEPVFWLVYGYKGNSNFDPSYRLDRAQKVKTYTSSNGVTVDKYSYTQTTEPEGMDIAKGTVEYIYELSRGNANAIIFYDVRPGESDQSQYIEEAIDTLKFL